MDRCRIGFGYDVHQLQPGKKLMLGGVFIPHTKGALGHSDADALLHALADALLGAAALGDIGQHFPDTDDRWKNIGSKVILQKVLKLLRESRFTLGNIDATVVLQQPKIMQYIPAMRKQIAAILEIDVSDVSVKATTTEQMGFAGRGEGIAVYAVAMVFPADTI